MGVFLLVPFTRRGQGGTRNPVQLQEQLVLFRTCRSPVHWSVQGGGEVGCCSGGGGRGGLGNGMATLALTTQSPGSDGTHAH